MGILKACVTTLNLLFILLIWFVSRSAKDRATAIGLGSMAALMVANSFLMWR